MRRRIRGRLIAFAERLTALFSRAPTEAAALGYNAELRIDHAIRLLGRLEPLTTIKTALDATKSRMDW